MRTVDPKRAATLGETEGGEQSTVAGAGGTTDSTNAAETSNGPATIERLYDSLGRRALTLDRYLAYESAGVITRPLTWPRVAAQRGDRFAPAEGHRMRGRFVPGERTPAEAHLARWENQRGAA
jgi:hypothetical protein